MTLLEIVKLIKKWAEEVYIAWKENHLIVSQIADGFLKNASSQLNNGDEICIAVPAWRQANGNFHFLNIVPAFTKYGYERIFVSDRPLLYFREDQVVARHLYILRKK